MLQAQGIQLTRRTVAKYREDMNIPSTHQRRKRDGRAGNKEQGEGLGIVSASEVRASFQIKMNECHPERSWARFAPNIAKDLFFPAE